MAAEYRNTAERCQARTGVPTKSLSVLHQGQREHVQVGRCHVLGAESFLQENQALNGCSPRPNGNDRHAAWIEQRRPHESCRLHDVRKLFFMKYCA